jgi:putative transposase
MSEYRRAYVPGGTYFFTVVTFKRDQILTTELARSCLHTAWEHVQRYHPFRAEAVCLLPDHLHCIWTLPANDVDFSRRWRIMKGIFSKQYLVAGGREAIRNSSRKRKGEAALWQRRFWEHWIQDEEDFQKHFDYIHFNPVRHGHVNEPVKWPWSSFHRHVSLGRYDLNWGSQEPESIKGFTCMGE